MTKAMHNEFNMMKRTQLYLTQEQHDWLQRNAKKQGTTMAKLTRKILAHHIAQPPSARLKENKEQTLGDFFLQMAKNAEDSGYKGPKDLASNVDKYLYHNDEKNFY